MVESSYEGRQEDLSKELAFEQTPKSSERDGYQGHGLEPGFLGTELIDDF